MVRVHLAFGLAFTLLAQRGQIQTSPAAQPQPFRADPDVTVPLGFACSAEGHVIRVSSKGKGTVSGPGARVSFQLNPTEPIVRLWCIAVDGSRVAFLWESRWYTGGRAGMAGIDLATGASLWALDLPTTDLGDPLRAGGELYVASSPQAFKVSLARGALLWSSAPIQDRRGPERPRLEGNRLVLTFGGRGYPVVLDPWTGEVVR
jgi:hypothetical protein